MNGIWYILYVYVLQAQEEAEARDLGIGLLRTSEELSEGEKGNGSDFDEIRRRIFQKLF